MTTCRSTGCVVSIDAGPAVGYRLAPALALRREDFGGIAYSYKTRRLRVVRSAVAVEVALRLDAGSCIADICDWLAARHPGHEGGRIVAGAIERLMEAGILVPVNTRIAAEP